MLVGLILLIVNVGVLVWCVCLNVMLFCVLCLSMICLSSGWVVSRLVIVCLVGCGL